MIIPTIHTMLSILAQVLHPENITLIPDVRDSLCGPEKVAQLA